VLGNELSGVVAELGYGTTVFTIGQRVFGMTDWTRNGSLAEYASVETRDLAALPISALTAWQGLFGHARLMPGQTVLIHGAAGAVGSMAVQLARDGRIANAWVELMKRLGYTRYVAQGRDVGAAVTDAMGRIAPEGLFGIHVNLLAGDPARRRRQVCFSNQLKLLRKSA
jgi:NADPH:quinone reductase-like Zn-dependent oxidoreductase